MPPLPDFLIVGAMRSGTTSVAKWLRQHPQVGFASVKEVHFFDRNFDRGTGWYRDHFPSDEFLAYGEATPNYCYHPAAISRMAEVVPDAHLLLFLRNPVDRAYSHYWHNRARGKEDLSFEDAVAAEPGRLRRGELERATFSYLDRGRYAEQIAKLAKHYPPSLVQVHLFDEVQADSGLALTRVCDFIGVDSTLGPEGGIGAVNAYTEFRSVRLRNIAQRVPGIAGRALARLNLKKSGGYEPMSATTRAQLDDHFAPLNRDLADTLGRPIPTWSN